MSIEAMMVVEVMMSLIKVMTMMNIECPGIIRKMCIIMYDGQVYKVSLKILLRAVVTTHISCHQ